MVRRSHLADQLRETEIRAGYLSLQGKPLEDWNLIPVSPLAHGGDFAVNHQDGVPRKVKILRCFEVQSVDLSVASKKAARDIRRKGDASSPAREQGIIARVEHDTAENFALGSRTLLRLDEVGRANSHIKNIDVLQLISQRCECICIDRLAQFHGKSVVALVILGAQIVCLRIKDLAIQGQSPIEQVRFGYVENKVLSFRAVLNA